MTILVTGGRGKTGSVLSRLLYKANYSVLIASRSGTAPRPYKAVKFDWFDDKTFENPFNEDSNIDRVYLILPGVLGQLNIVRPFIDLAISKGVKRFVLLSGSQSECGNPRLVGKVHEYLVNIQIDYAVLRPTWFMQNFGAPGYYQSIRERNEICSVTEDGRIPFVSVEDIGRAAYDALVCKQSPNREIHIFGPELFSYEEVAQLLTELLGRKITFRRLSVDDEKKMFIAFGLEPKFAKFLAVLESNIARGVEEHAFNAEGHNKFFGKHTLRKYLKANKHIWVK